MQAWPTGFASCWRRCKLAHRVRQQAGSYRCSVTASPRYHVIPRTPAHRHHVIPSPRCGVIGTACALAMFFFGDHHRARLLRCSFVGARLPAKGSYRHRRCKLTLRVRQQAGSLVQRYPHTARCRCRCRLTLRVCQQAGSYRCRPDVTPCKATGFRPCASCPIAAGGR
jgi:hypothetical protein